MARPDLTSKAALRASFACAVVTSFACTVFNGKTLPEASDGGVPSTCDPARVERDPQNCGTCGHDCLGGACSGGVCQAVALVPASDAGGAPIDIAVDKIAVYWASDDGTIHSIAKDGGTPSTLGTFANAAGDARIAVDENAIYYANEATATVYALTKDGQNRLPVYTEPQGMAPGGLASNGTALYWTHVSGSTFGGIMRAPLPSDGGGATETWPNRQVFPEIAVDDHDVYWLENYRSIMRGALDGTGAAAALNYCTDVNGIALGDASVFWTSTAGVMSTRKDAVSSDNGQCAAATAISIAADDAGANGIAVAAGLVVWTDTASGTVRAAAASGICSGSCVRTLASGQASPGRAAADDRAAYWINGDGSIGKVAF